MQKYDTRTPISARLDNPRGARPARRRRPVRHRGRDPAGGRRIHNALKNTGGTPELTIHATTALGDITARSL